MSRVFKGAFIFLTVWVLIASSILIGLTWWNNRQTNALVDTKIEAMVRHPVTPEMWKSAGSFSNVIAPSFRLPDVNGKLWSLSEISKGRPVVLYFIKQGCPCSIDVEPLLQKMSRQLGQKIAFVGIINVDAKDATAWIEDMKSPLLVLLDPNCQTMKTYKAQQSVYTALIRRDGTIDKFWPGYSASMLRELYARAAELSGAPASSFDPDYAPTQMTSGCRFYD